MTHPSSESLMSTGPDKSFLQVLTPPTHRSTSLNASPRPSSPIPTSMPPVVTPEKTKRTCRMINLQKRRFRTETVLGQRGRGDDGGGGGGYGGEEDDDDEWLLSNS